jgi:hypothetical protein
MNISTADRPASVTQANCGVDVPDLVYVLAASHSGSTLLAMLLGSHDETVTVGELAPSGIVDPSNYRCSCRAFLAECPFWSRIAGEMRGGGIDFTLTDFGTRFRDGQSSLERRLLRPLHRGKLAELVRDAGLACTSWRRRYAGKLAANRALVASIKRVTGRRVVVDSSKSGLRLKYLLRVPGLKVKVVRLVRDGRGVALTYVNPAEFADAKDPKLRGNREAEKLSMSDAAREWRRSNEEAEHVLAGMRRDQWIQVRYEDYCRAPVDTLGAIFSFLGLNPDGWSTDFREREYHVLGNGMRFDTTSEIVLDERWRDELTAEDLAAFRRVAGTTLRRYGYE